MTKIGKRGERGKWASPGCDLSNGVWGCLLQRVHGSFRVIFSTSRLTSLRNDNLQSIYKINTKK